MFRHTLCSLLALAVFPAAAAGESFLPETAAFRGETTLIPMRDGNTLAADIYIPRRAGKSPVVLVQTPYNRKLLRRHWTGEIDDGTNPLFTDTNYAFVVTDWRGRYESKDAL